MCPVSSAICLPMEKRYPRRSHGKQISEHTKLLEGQRSSALLESRPSVFGTKDVFGSKNVQLIRIEEPIQALRPNPKVVVLKVSLHCNGCAKKVKKHISKMEGVTSIAIDLEKKKVTVTGNVSPIGVLESICKVKRAEFWPTSIII